MLPAAYDINTLAIYQVYGFYLLCGAAKLLLPSSVFAKEFPSLPRWLWPAVGGWEIACVLMYLIEQHSISLCMSAAVMGGVFFSILFLEGQDGKTMFTRNGGLGTIPAFASLASTIIAHHHLNVDGTFLVLAFAGGFVTEI
eukprot:gene26063-31470_t